MFRSGRAGVALLIIRFCLVGTLVVHFRQFGAASPLWWSAPILLSVAITLGAGVLTSIGCFLFCGAELVLMLDSRGFGTTLLILSIPVAIALALLGPGAYSFDARIFGRRVIVLPPDNC